MFSDAGEVAARDLEGRRQQQDLGDAAHADAARAHEVEAPQPQKPHRVASASKSSWARSRRGVGPGEGLRLLAHRGQARPVLHELGDRPGEALGRRAPSPRSRSRRPAAVERPRVLELVAGGGGAERARGSTGRPAAASSDDGHRARRGRARGPPRPSPPRAAAGTARASSSAGTPRVALRGSRSGPSPRSGGRPRGRTSRAARRPRAMARLMTREPWLPPKTRRRRVVAVGIERRRSRRTRGARASRSRRPASCRCALAAASPTAVRVANRFRKRLATPGSALDSWMSGRDAERARGHEHRHRDVAAHADDDARPVLLAGARGPRGSPSAAGEGAELLAPASCPTKPDASTSSSGKPAAGTSLLLEPLRRARRRRSRAPGFWARISLASAMPGTMCPPVPPAAMT